MFGSELAGTGGYGYPESGEPASSPANASIGADVVADNI